MLKTANNSHLYDKIHHLSYKRVFKGFGLLVHEIIYE